MIVSIPTAQQVDLQIRIADLSKRILAWFIDICIQLAYYFLVFILSNLFEDSAQIKNAFLYIMMIPVIFYNFIFEYALDGQTFGKRFTQIRVIRLDGQSMDILDHFLRFLLRIAEITVSFGGIAIITIITNNRSQRFGDIVAGTCVIDLKRQSSLRDTIYVEINRENYNVTYSSVLLLKDKDLNLIKQLLNNFKTEASTQNSNLIRQCATKVRSLLNVYDNKSSADFLQTILNDYNFLTQQM